MRNGTLTTGAAGDAAPELLTVPDWFYDDPRNGPADDHPCWEPPSRWDDELPDDPGEDLHTVPPPLVGLRQAVERLMAAEVWQLSDAELLERLDQLGGFADRLRGEQLRTIAETQRRRVCEEQQGWTVADRVTDTDRLRPRQGRAMVRLAEQLERFRLIAAAVGSADVTVEQATAICTSLKELPVTADPVEVEGLQVELIIRAAEFPADALRRLANRLVEELEPDTVEERLGAQLEAEERRAQRDRYLTWRHGRHGSVDFHGRLPAVAGEAFIGQLDAYEKHARAKGVDHRIDPQAEVPTLAQRRADSLTAMIDDLSQRQLAPTVHGDRPRVVIAIDYDQLLAGLRSGGVILGSDETVTPGEARRLACGADLLPAVFGGPSTVLDLGRRVRLFTGALRQALTLRDGGCAFPGCDVPPIRCEGHHLRPWWDDGETCLSNGVLLCAHHHQLVEPDPAARPGSRWTIRLDRHGLPEVIPPVRIDPRQRPRQHARFTERSMRLRR
ncbi:HNH endonuclease signature motif containing protein [Microlunatus soli]|uniref:HNH nuclease domain-containing protein n=1 Tax=Microlunatus soli TaxID=630515 RepID=A0A1H1PHV9_9ACTN|nr:HNH endonuclease signature motif containing protein [Microlunatus soli]SDS10703.1 protein of unknown function [Microlunatus soli]